MRTQLPPATTTTELQTGAKGFPARHARGKASRVWLAALHAVVGRDKSKKAGAATTPSAATPPPVAATPARAPNNHPGQAAEASVRTSPAGVGATGQALKAASAAKDAGAEEPTQADSSLMHGRSTQTTARTQPATAISAAGGAAQKQGQGGVDALRTTTPNTGLSSLPPRLGQVERSANTSGAKATGSLPSGAVLSSDTGEHALSGRGAHTQGPSPAHPNVQAGSRATNQALDGSVTSTAPTPGESMAHAGGAKHGDASTLGQSARSGLAGAGTHATRIPAGRQVNDSNASGTTANGLAGTGSWSGTGAVQVSGATSQTGSGAANASSPAQAGGNGANPATLGGQTLQSLNAQIHTLHRAGGGQATIQLDPPSLGHIHIQLQVSGQNRAQVHFSAAQPATAQALQASLGQLTTSLHQNGIHVQHSEVNATAPDSGIGGQSGSPSQHGQPGQQQDSTGQALSARATHADPAAPKRADDGGRAGVRAYA